MLTERQQRIADWLARSRPEGETQEALAEDITRVTGWKIDRSRYSKYESGSLPVGALSLQHFVDYWKTRGVDGPDEQDPEPAAEPASEVAELVNAITAQTKALDELATQMKALAERDRAPESGRDEALVNAIAGAVALAVRTTLQAAGLVVEPPSA